MIFYQEGGTVKFEEGDHNFFAALKGGGGVTVFLVLTKSCKCVYQCTTHLQHVIEYDSGLL